MTTALILAGLYLVVACWFFGRRRRDGWPSSALEDASLALLWLPILLLDALVLPVWRWIDPPGGRNPEGDDRDG